MGMNILVWKPEGERLWEWILKKCHIRTCAGLIWLRVVAYRFLHSMSFLVF